MTDTKLPADTEELWNIIAWFLGAADNDSERQKIRRLLQRRLSHPEAFNAGLAGNQRGLEREHWAERNRKTPRYDSPPCICGASRKVHAEDGSYSPNGCDMFTRAP